MIWRQDDFPVQIAGRAATHHLGTNREANGAGVIIVAIDIASAGGEQSRHAKRDAHALAATRTDGERRDRPRQIFTKDGASAAARDKIEGVDRSRIRRSRLRMTSYVAVKAKGLLNIQITRQCPPVRDRSPSLSRCVRSKRGKGKRSN